MEKKLYKSRQDKMISGVCGGLANYFSLDSSIVRLAVVLLTFATSGALLVVYLLMAALVPYEPLYNSDGSYNYYSSGSTYNKGYTTHSKNKYDSYHDSQSNPQDFSEKVDAVGKHNVGLFLIALGLALFLGKIIPGFYSTYFVPLLLLIAGVIILISSTGRNSDRQNDTRYKSGSAYNYTSSNSSYDTADAKASNDEEDIIVDVEEEIIIEPEEDVEQKVENGEGI